MVAMAMVSFASQLLAAAATLLSLCLMAASAGSAVFTLCVNGGNNANTPFHDVDGTVISEAVQATNSSDRSSSVMCNRLRRITTTTGPDREMDYALAQCRADVPAGDCSSCLGACLDTIGHMCDSAAVRYDVCLLRFAKQDFSIFDVSEYTVSVFDGRSQPGLPKDVTTGLLSKVAANATANRSRTAAGIADYPAAGGRASVYGLAQCITQMSAPAGHCFQEGEMFLVYEYLMNKSISNYFKGSVDRQKLDWPKWLNIIKGIARGLAYLHRESGKDIVHRDLKPSNVLLDSNFAPKIADFDLARGYNRERSHEVTHNRAGTLGYIAPECYAEGKFSTKSDVYSYGVMVLEIIVGQSISRFDNENCMGLVEHVWLHWSDCRVGDMLDRDHLGLVNHEQMQQASRCVQVALLCVQKDRSARPAMDEVIHLLNGEMSLRVPSVPGYIAAPAGSPPSRHSVNGVTISVEEPRS